MSGRVLRDPPFDVEYRPGGVIVGLTSDTPIGPTLIVQAGKVREERIVPPAGEEHAWEREMWDCRVEVYVSPNGQRTRVWVDGVEVRSR
jgi:hypothetical protein